MDKWDKAYKKILIKESSIYGYNNNPYRVREQAPPVPEQGQGGQETQGITPNTPAGIAGQQGMVNSPGMVGQPR